MRCRYDGVDPVGQSGPAERDRFIPVTGAIVDAGKTVEMNINH